MEFRAGQAWISVLTLSLINCLVLGTLFPLKIWFTHQKTGIIHLTYCDYED